MNRKKIYQTESTIKRVANIENVEGRNRMHPGGGLIEGDSFDEYEEFYDGEAAAAPAVAAAAPEDNGEGQMPTEQQLLAASLLEATQQMADLITSMGSSLEQVRSLETL